MTTYLGRRMRPIWASSLRSYASHHLREDNIILVLLVLNRKVISNAFVTRMITAITALFAGLGTLDRKSSTDVRIIGHFIKSFCLVEVYFESVYLYAGRRSYGLSVCSPIQNPKDQFLGAYCADIIPTNIIREDSSKEDNYIKNMYLNTVTDKVNYVITDEPGIVRVLIFNIPYSGMGKPKTFLNH